MKSHVIVPLIVACALFMQNLDSTSLATALPAIAASLGEQPLRLHMAITAYMLALAAFLPMSGWVADRYGARNISVSPSPSSRCRRSPAASRRIFTS